ncbi:polymorphic toxin-type HINT domain-containing protein [Cellulomonas sp. PSBB021]|uniref:polymorphic toxin-type HINT domain-containing protein n=1 Tax=Cellulomonas sp. PSBB021 TaxID=2003551 RepID=UPI0012FE05A3|nr:polymorphic toxin-type HINT domain-containing protein [Cellulomonas sp. PSBB021]
MAEAVAAAHGCDDDVVVTGALDPWTALVATPRGTLRQEVTAGAVRTDVNGAWEPVDPRVVVAPGTGVLRVAAPVTPITFSRASRGRAVTFETEAGDVALTVPVSLGAPRVDGTHVVYPLLAATGQPVDGAVLTVEVHADGSGVTPAIELRDREAYEQVRAAAGADGLGFEVVAEDGLSVHPADVGFTVVDGTGATVLAGGAAYQWDSAGAGEPGALEYSGLALADGTARPTSDDEGHEGAVLSPAPGDSRAELHATATERGTAFLAADQAMLEDASTTWPVVIDPPISGIVRNDWTVLRSSFPPLHRTSASEGVGRCRPADDASCTGDFSSRMFWRFTSMSVLKELKDDDVVAAFDSVVGGASGLLGAGLGKAAAKFAAPAARRLGSSLSSAVKSVSAKTSSAAAPAARGAAKAGSAAKAKPSGSSPRVPEGAACRLSFSGDTRVLLASGASVRIDELKVGDEVMAADPQAGKQRGEQVEAVHEHQDALIVLVIDGAQLRTTEDHPFWSVSDQRYERADHLSPGELVLTSDGRTATVDAVVDDEPLLAPAYTLTVSDLHTYFVLASTPTTTDPARGPPASSTPILVHNCDVAANTGTTSERISSPLWTAGKSDSAPANALRHFNDHGADFPGINNSLEYVADAQSFLRSPPSGTLTRLRTNGDVVRYNPGSNTFGVMDSSGAPRTYFRPDPAQHGYPTNLDYFNAQ